MSCPRDWPDHLTPDQADEAERADDLAAYEDWLACFDGAAETRPIAPLD